MDNNSHNTCCGSSGEHAYGCPNALVKLFSKCAKCEREIILGDEYSNYDGDIYCIECGQTKYEKDNIKIAC